jgi:tetratricopeptide (TPR) repeat protein
MSFTGWHSRTLSKILIVTILVAFLSTACSVRPYRMKRAERLYRQGQSYLSQGERSKAAEKFEESLEISRMIAFRPGIAHNLNEMAIIHTTQGEFAKAREILSESLEIYKELDMAPEVSKTLNNIVVTYAKAGRFEEALAKYEELLDWDGETGNRLGQAITLNNMGLIYQNHLRDAEKAREKYTAALKIFEDLGQEEYANTVRKSLASLRQ